MPSRYLAYDSESAEYLETDNFEEAKKYVCDLPDCDDGYNQGQCDGSNFIAEIIYTTKFTETDRKSNYPCLKDSKETASCSNCDDCTCELDAEEWPYRSEFDSVGIVHLEPYLGGNDSVIKRSLKWIVGDRVGLSSKAIFTVMMNVEKEFLHTPCDPADFDYCHGLLKLIPEWKDRFNEMGKRSEIWSRLVLKWDELTELFEAKDFVKFIELLDKTRSLKD